MAAATLAYTSLCDEVIYTSLAFLVARVPVLYCRVLDLRVLLDNDLDHSRVKLILVAHRCGTSLHIAYIRTLVSYDQRPLELTCTGRVDSEIARQLHRTAHALRDIYKRTVAEYGRIQGRIEIVAYRHHGSEVLAYKVRMLLYGLRERAEYDSLLCQCRTECSRH